MNLLAVLIASLAGSLHCAGMCGGFAAMCAGTSPSGGRVETVAYSAGRGLVYVAMGVAAGAIGAALDVAGLRLAGVQNVAGVLMGATLVGVGLWTLLSRRAVGERPIALGARPRRSLLGRARMAMAHWLRQPGPWASLAVGLLSGLLPCGWLWGFVLAAAATADPISGGASMLAFWLGTLPALGLVGLVAAKMRATVGRHARKLVAIAMIGLGVYSFVARPSPDSPSDQPCHAEP